MTTTNPDVLHCPRCRSTSVVGLSGGDLLCIDCRQEWNPADPPALSVVPDPLAERVGAALDATSPADWEATGTDQLPDAFLAALEAGDDRETATEPVSLESMLGTDVVLEGGQRATIVGFPDDDHMEVIVAEGTEGERFEVVGYNDVERSVTAPPPALDVPDDVAEGLARVNFAVAGLVIRAGLGALAGEGDDVQLVTPPSGWLPLDTEGLPAVEQGAAYAVAFLVDGFKLDRDIVSRIADQLLNDAQTTEPTKGGTEHDRSDTDNDRRDGTDTAGARTDQLHGESDRSDSQ